MANKVSPVIIVGAMDMEILGVILWLGFGAAFLTVVAKTIGGGISRFSKH